MTENGLRNFNGIDFIECPTLHDACLHLADDVAHLLATAIATQGSAYFAAPGGTSPAPFFASLSARQIDWPKVRITLTDERWVPEDSSDSNARLVRLSLLRGPASQAIFIPPRTMHKPIQEAAAEWDFTLRRGPTFDLVILGMGEDGHFASLFPNDENLAQHLDPSSDALAVAAQSQTPQRLSLTLRAIIRAKRLVLLMAGEKKRAILHGALNGDPKMANLPITALLRLSNVTPTCYFGAVT